MSDHTASSACINEGADIHLDDLFDQPVISREKKSAALKQGCAAFCQSFNKRLRYHIARCLPGASKIPMLESHDFYGNMSEHDYANKFAAAWEAGCVDGVSGNMNYEDTVDAVVRTLAGLLSDTPHVAIDAPTQSGKGGIQLMSVLLYRLICNRTHKVHVALFPYGRKAPAKEMRMDYRAARNVYANLQFSGCPTTLSGANNQVATVGHDELSSRTTMKRAKSTILRAKQENATEVVLCLDEADNASGSNSILNKLFNEARAMERKYGVRLRLICVSATTQEFGKIDGFTRVEIKKLPGQGYWGYVQGNQIPIHSMSSVGTLLKLRDLCNDFEVSANGAARVSSVCKMISALFRGVDAPAYNLNGLPCNGGRAIAVRYGHSATADKLRDHFLSHYAKRLGVTVVKYAGRVLKHRVEDIMSMNPGPLLIILLGAGRRSDRFPKDCAVFLDFTHASASLEAHCQGLIGRSSGFKNDNLFVMVSDRNMITVLDDRAKFARDNDLDSSSLPSMRAMVMNGSNRKVNPISMYKLLEEDTPVEIWAPMAEYALAHIRPHLSTVVKDRKDQRIIHEIRLDRAAIDPRFTRLMNKKTLVSFKALLGGDINIGRITSFLRDRFRSEVNLLMPSEIGEGDRRYEGEGDFISLNVSNYDRDQHGGDDSGDRDNRRTASAHGGKQYKKLVVNLGFRYQNNDPAASARLAWVQIHFAQLTKNYAGSSAGIVRLPTSRCAYHGFMPAHQVQQQNDHIAAQVAAAVKMKRRRA